MSVLKALARLIRSAGYDVRTFSRLSALLADDLPTTNARVSADAVLFKPFDDRLLLAAISRSLQVKPNEAGGLICRAIERRRKTGFYPEAS